MPQAPEGQVFMHPATPDAPREVLPPFPRVASVLDRLARRVPWYGWVLGTLGLLWWSQRKGKRRSGS